jgi:cation diffusion facilitator family transporter
LNPSNKNIQIQKWVAALSVILLLTKLAAYYLTHSVSILTDALESIVNVVAGFIGLYSLYLSAKPRDEDHPYGHGKAEFLSASIEGSMIFIAGILILYKSFDTLLHPRQIQKLDIGILLIGISAVANFIMGSLCVRTGNKNNSLALIASGKHLQSDTYSTIGILVGLGLIYFTHINWVDSLVAIIFGILILFTGYKIVRKSIAGIMDEVDLELLNKLVDTLNKNRRVNWIDLHNLRIIKYGSLLHLDCHVTVPWYLNVNEAHAEIEALGQLVREEFGNSLELFVHSDGCEEFSCRICDKLDCPVRKHLLEKKVQWTVENISTDHKHTVNS